MSTVEVIMDEVGQAPSPLPLTLLWRGSQDSSDQSQKLQTLYRVKPEHTEGDSHGQRQNN